MAADRRIPTGRLVRALKPAATGARAALANARTLITPAGDRDAKAQRQLDQAIRSAQQVADLMGEMKGAFMKVGQLLSFADTSMLPPEVRGVLATLQADAPPMAYDLVAEVITSELGAPPDKAFDWFSPVPMASASIGQVHSARLGDDEVVVKVQYPGVADAVAADLNNAGLMAAFARTVQPFARAYMGRVDIKPLIEEVRARVLEELDYDNEARNQQAFADLYRGHPFIRIPEVYAERSTAKVLTSAYHDGMRYAAAVQADQALRDTWGEVVCRFSFGSLYRYGIANADPHPGNYLFHEDGAVTFLDFGCVKRLGPDQVEALTETGRAALAQDVDRYGRASVAAGFFPEGLPAELIYKAMRGAYLMLLEDQPFTYTPEKGREIIEFSLGLAEDYKTVVRDFELPADFAFVGRIGLGAQSVLTGLRATGWWRAVMDEIWNGAPPATELGRVEERWRNRNTPDTDGS